MTAEELIAELRMVVLKIGLMSHVGAAVPGRSSKTTDDDIGGRRPSGGLDWRGDREPEYAMKTAEYFQRKIDRCNNVMQLEALVGEARAALQAWTRTPAPQNVGMDPVEGTFYWKCKIADEDLPIKEIQALYSVSRSTVNRYRAKYRGVLRMFGTV